MPTPCTYPPGSCFFSELLYLPFASVSVDRRSHALSQCLCSSLAFSQWGCCLSAFAVESTAIDVQVPPTKISSVCPTPVCYLRNLANQFKFLTNINTTWLAAHLSHNLAVKLDNAAIAQCSEWATKSHQIWLYSNVPFR